VLNKSTKGQINAAEYVVVISLVAASVMGMTVFFRRALQARLNDARHYAVDYVDEHGGGDYVGEVLPEYEVYYTNSVSFLNHEKQTLSSVIPGESQGTFYKNFVESSSHEKTTILLPPEDVE